MPARRRLASLLAGLDSWVIEMGGGASTAAFPGSAIGLIASVRRRFQSKQFFGRCAVGARGGWLPAGLCDFGGFASESLRSAAGVPQTCGCGCALGLLARRLPRLRSVRGSASAGVLRPVCAGLRARMVSRGFPRCASVVSSGSVLRPACAGSRARPDIRGFGFQNRSGFHGARLTRRSAGRRGLSRIHSSQGIVR